jgi:excisionase family DNA binding protein
MSAPLLHTVPEAGGVLRVSRTKVFEMIAAGELRSVKIGRRRLVPADAIEELVERLSQEQQPGATVA